MSQFKIGKIYELESPKRGSFVGKFLGGDSTKASNFAELTMMERAREAAIGDNWNELELPGFRETILNVPEAQRSVVAMMFSSNDPEKQKAAVKRVDPNAVFGADNNGLTYTSFTHPSTGEQTQAYLNRPGADMGDVTMTAGEALSVAGPGKLLGMGKAGIGLMNNMFKGSLAGGTGSVGRDVTSNIASGDSIPEAVLGEGSVDVGRALTEGAMEAGAVGLFDMLPIIAPPIKKYLQDTGGKVIDRFGNPTEKIQRILREYGVAWEETTQAWRDDLFRRVTGGETFDALEAARLADANTLPGPNVPMTRGSISGQPGDQLYEDQMRKGVFGQEAATGLNDFDNLTGEALEDNLTEMQRLIAGDSPIVNRGEGAASVQQTLSGQRRQAKDEVEDLYDTAKTEGADARFNDRPPESLIYPSDPGAQSPTILNAFADSMESYLNSNFARSDVGGGASELLNDFRALVGGDSPATVNELMLWRQKLGSGAFGTPDSVARGNMKKMFDDHFEQAMQNDLISGNPAAVASWKEATDKYKDFARTWKSKDLVDRITQTRPGALDDGVELIVAPADAANYIFNVSNLGFSTKRELQRDILKMKKLLPESDFNLLKQELFIRMVDAGRMPNNALSGAKFRSGIEKMIRENSAVLNAAFPKEQVDMIRQFGRVADMANNTARNNSNSGIVNVTRLGDIAKNIATMFALRGNMAETFLMRIPGVGMTLGSDVRARLSIPSSQGYQGTPRRTGPVLPSTATAILNDDELMNLTEEQREIVR